MKTDLLVGAAVILGIGLILLGLREPPPKCMLCEKRMKRCGRGWSCENKECPVQSCFGEIRKQI